MSQGADKAQGHTVDMQDIAREITELLEPTEPLGYRFVIYGGPALASVLLEAKAVRFKSRVGFMVRCIQSYEYNEPIPPITELPSMFAPSEDALKFLIRTLCSKMAFNGSQDAVLIPSHISGYDRCHNGNIWVDFCLEYSQFPVGASDSVPEKALSETVAALTLMQLPVGLKWETGS